MKGADEVYARLREIAHRDTAVSVSVRAEDLRAILAAQPSPGDWLRGILGVVSGLTDDQIRRIEEIARRRPAPPAPAAVPGDGEIVLFALNAGFGVTKNEPTSYLTDAANAEMAWSVSRVAPPFCGRMGERIWSGPTPTAAVEKAVNALGMKMPAKPAAPQGADLGKYAGAILEAWMYSDLSDEHSDLLHDLYALASGKQQESGA